MTADSGLPAHVQALLAPGALDPAGGAAALVQTHISFVLLAGDRVIKLKKPVNLGFLDHTTLDRRRAACEAEVILNRRLTSGVYLGIAPVLRLGDGHHLGPLRPPSEGEANEHTSPQDGAADIPQSAFRTSHSHGEVVDYAVVMRRLPADRMMDELVARDAVTPAMMEQLARHLAGFYARAATGGEIDGFAAPEALLTNWQENLLQTLPYAGRTIGVRAYVRVARAVYAELLRLRPLLAERIAVGRARDCHGDLRLSAVCFADQIQVYDCIEFNDRFRYGDVAADIAFLTMDLDGHGRADLGDEFLARFVAASGDTTLTAVLPFYQCYRAYVRGKVDGFLLDEPEAPAAQRRAARTAARHRFAQAAAYARSWPLTLAAIPVGDDSDAPLLGAVLAGRLGAVLIRGVVAEAREEIASRLSTGLSTVLLTERVRDRDWDELRALATRGRARLLRTTPERAEGSGRILALPASGTVRERLRAWQEVIEAHSRRGGYRSW